MPKPRRSRKRLSLRMAWAALFSFTIGLIALIAATKLLPNPGGNEEIARILREAADDRAARAASAAAARANMPPAAAIPATWDYRAVLGEFRKGRLNALVALTNTYLENTEDIPEFQLAKIRQAIEESGFGPPDSPFHFEYDPDKSPRAETLARLGEFLVANKTLVEAETALRYGLFEDLPNAYRSPLDSELVGLAVLLAGRAMGELRAGDAASALETLLAGYRLTAYGAGWPHYYGHSHWYFGNKMLDKTLWRLVDTASLSDMDRQRLLEALDARKTTAKLAKALRIQAANAEIGEEAQEQGYPKPVDIGFAFAGREAMDRMKQFIPLLEQPPFQTRDRVAPIARHVLGGYWVNRLLDGGVMAYELHARDALEGDMARIAFALNQWRAAHGAYPATLEEVQPFPLPAIPLEPLTGAPVTYEAAPQTFTISGPADAIVWPEQYWVAK